MLEIIYRGSFLSIEMAQVVALLYLWVAWARLSCIVNTMAADDIVTQGARASTAMAIRNSGVSNMNSDLRKLQ